LKWQALFIIHRFAAILSARREHDRVSLCTSQLAHVLSNAYVRSETALRSIGFRPEASGIWRGLLHRETMWSELFLLNREN
jgi:prephenate dehydrogenase